MAQTAAIGRRRWRQSVVCSPVTESEPAPLASSKPPRARLARLLSLAAPQWPALAVGTVFLLLGSGMGLLYPQAIRVFLDEALLEGNLAVVDQAALVLAAVFAVQATAVAARYYLFTVAGERIVAQLREDLYTSIIAQEVGFFDASRTGGLTNRLASDTAVLQNTVSVNISMALRSVVSCMGGLALLVYTSPVLTLLMLAVVPPITVGSVVAGRLVRRISRQVQDALAEAGEVAEETIAGVRTVRAFAREEQEVVRYRGAVLRAFELARRRTRYGAWLQGVASFFGFGSLAIVLWYGGRLVLNDEMTVGEVTAFLLYTGVVAMALGTMASLWTDFMRAVGAADRVFELIDRAPLIPSHGGLIPDHLDGRLAFEGVGFVYPTRPAVQVLSDVNLEIDVGERIALVGPSGGGKSTIGNLIPRFYDPLVGRVVVDGHDLRDLDAEWLRRQIAIVAQEPILFSTTIAENIRYGSGATNGAVEVAAEEIERAARTANAHDFVMEFPDGYETLVGERGVRLSGGQKQRIAIARAVLRDPRILILDEATSALDAESEHLVKEALDRLMRQRTTLIIAHRLSTVIGADRVVVIDRGRVLQIGPHAELMQQEEGLYRRLVEHQFVEA